MKIQTTEASKVFHIYVYIVYFNRKYLKTISTIILRIIDVCIKWLIIIIYLVNIIILTIIYYY